MNIFLTGHLGFIGSHLYKKLIELGIDVETNLRYLHTDKYDCVIHLAAKNNIKNEFDPDVFESNVVFAKEIFSVPTKIIYASSCVAEFPLNPYAYSKLYAEHLAKIHGTALGLRLHNVYGPNNKKGIVWWLMQQPDGSKITIRGEKLVRDYIYVDDVVNVIVNNLYESIFWNGCSPVLNVGAGIGLETMDVVNMYQQLSGKRFDISIEEPGSYEPERMVSDDPIPNALSFYEGLSKTIQLENK